MTSTTDTVLVSGRFVVETYDVADCRDRILGWDGLDRVEKLQRVDRIEPTSRQEVSNTTCVGFHRLVVDVLDAGQAVDGLITHLALGRGSTTPAESNTALTDEVDRVEITQYTDEGSSIETRTFVGEGEANVDVAAGEDISEVGLYAGSYFLNHSLLATPIEKDNQTTATVTATLTFSAQ